VIVEVKAGLGEARGMLRCQRAERDTRFHAETFDRVDHVADGIKIAIFWRAPGRGHAEARSAGILRALCGRNHIGATHQTGRFQAGRVMRALRAVAAVLRTAAGLDAEQARSFDVVWIEVLAMSALRLKHQVGKRKVVERLSLFDVPMITNLRPVASFLSLDLHSSIHNPISLSCR
jgi:hypothetical protein